MYKLAIEKPALKSLNKIPPDYLLKIKSAINGLVNNPRPFGCKKLSDSEDKYRIRVGVYRIIYTIKDDILTVRVVKVGHRRSVYDDK
ncbi:hypothetical protein AGMMS49965_01920 [Bacteroidia bacterium]|nr:hypothetical protein AGMMS4957_19270 [Bacteroidia bacterium]GHT38463.1 hypothetical protein AGMMS49965_01920 [Bacteroidia bacterium]